MERLMMTETTTMNKQKGGYKCATFSVPPHLTIIMEDYDYA